MTIPVSDRLSQLYVGNGTNKRFEFTFRVFQQEDETGISIRKKGAVEFETLDPSTYVVQINQDDMGGYVTFNTAPESGTYFYIAGTTSLDQLLDITNYDNFYPDAIERALDKLTALLQERITEIDQEKQSRILADLKYDALAMEREDNLENRLTSYINAMLGVTNPAIFDGISDRMIITKDGRTQREFNESIPFWTDEFVKFMQETYLREEQIIDHIEEQIAVEKDRAQIAESNLNTKIDNEKTRALAAEALLSSSIGAVGQGYFKSYPTLAAANADIANIPLSVSVKVLSSIDGGDYYKANAGATSLTKSPYDPVVIAAADAQTKADAAQAAAIATSNSNTDAKLVPVYGQIVEKPYAVRDIFGLATIDGYIRHNGTVITSTSFKRSDFIAVSQGQIVDATSGAQTELATIAEYDGVKTFIRASVAPSNSGSYSPQITIDSKTKFIIVSFFKSTSVTQSAKITQPQVYKDFVTQAEFDVLASNDNFANVYKQREQWDSLTQYTIDGTTLLGTTGYSCVTKKLIKAGQKIKCLIYGQPLGAVEGIKFYGDDGSYVFTQIPANSDGTTTRKYVTLEYTPTVDGYFSINSYTLNIDTTSIYYSVFKAGIYVLWSEIGVSVPSKAAFDLLNKRTNRYWEGKKIVWVGTSIPAFTAASGLSYPYLVGQALGCEMINRAQGESWITFNAANPIVAGNASYKTLSATKAEIRAFMQAYQPDINEVNLQLVEQASYEFQILGRNADLVVFDHMINDMGKPYISFGSIDNNTDRKTFFGAFNYIIEKIYLDTPNARIAFVSCPTRYELSEVLTIAKHDQYRDALRQLALKYNAPFIDLAILSNVHQNNYKRWTNSVDEGNTDYIHPSAAARVRYANILAEAIRGIG
ncbi:GDSL-type esterase/lipase family protein [Acinetobacter soli]|uniref:GDSL-type esterase/lipase family protein n=1 Tax=Acinetobacter soli TaxID=487316 RepID=UPI002D805008|nr:GDSL-type esterase/lipase family protein [Acinetobacter soli]MEB4800692.1 GDSL-type esterase/lipase family protein [Acinetobacter soli]